VETELKLRIPPAALNRACPAELSSAYPWYFTLPFDRLAAERRDAN